MLISQILTGSCNANDQCLAIGSICSYTFITYGSGSDLVILNHDFIRQQIIPGCKNDNSQINSVSCTLITGKIIVLYSNGICVYEPQGKVDEENFSGLDKYIWVLLSVIKIDVTDAKDLCWIPKLSDAFILVGKYLKVYQYNKIKSQFYVEFNETLNDSWNCVWYSESPDNKEIDMIKFSSDGKYFATLSVNSQNILIWFWDQFSYLYFDNNHQSTLSNELFDYIVIKHPSNIISFEWRLINSLVPLNSINNSLLTCSSDNVCRIWSENYLNQYKKFSNSNEISNSNHKETTVSEYVKSIFLNHLKAKGHKDVKEFVSVESEFKYNVKDSDYVYTYPEFILSASINDTTDIPLFKTLNSGELKSPFIVHWLNNKDYNFNHRIEKCLNSLTTNLKTPDSNELVNEDVDDKILEFNRLMVIALRKWKKSCDVVFSIHPQNGSLLVWFVHNLDESGGHIYDNKSLIIDKSIHIKNSQITIHSCLPNCIPVADATSMNSNILLYSEEIPLKSFENTIYETSYDFSVNYDVRMVSKQQNGSLNMWNLTMPNEENGNSSFLNIKHLSRISGHRWQTNSAACHIHLPFLLTISNLYQKSKNTNEQSELILWRIKHIGPFSKSGGITEIARINSANLNFVKVAWFPGSVPNYLFDIEMSSPASFFVATDSYNNLFLYISIADAKNILENNYKTKDDASLLHPKKENNFEIVSITSTGEPGCILSAGKFENGISSNIDYQKATTMLLHVFPKNMILSDSNVHIENQSRNDSESKEKYCETYFIMRIIMDQKNQSYLEMWKVQIMDLEKKFKQPVTDFIKLKIVSEKVYSSPFNLPRDIYVVKVVPAASHLSSASIYPSCLAPYLITCLCSDGSIRFWKCSTDFNDSNFKYEWLEWKMLSQEKHSSTLYLKENCVSLEVSCAYSGRIAVAYSYDVFENVTNGTTVHINVDIYECESTGGSEWILEDSIKFDDANKCVGYYENKETDFNFKDTVHIDWVNSEDGSYLLSIALGTKIMIFTPTCLEICKYSRFTSETSSLSNFTHWIKINEVNLRTADSLPPLPEHISWSREGLLIVGLDNEVHVYNQWNSHVNSFNDCINEDNKYSNELIKRAPQTNYSLARLKDAYFFNQNLKRSSSETHLKNSAGDNNVNSSDEVLQNASLFEAAQIHNPVLPQYHPKQLMEWINFGKIKRVKAILSHLTDCITVKNITPTNVISSSSTDKVNNKVKQADENIFERSQLEIKAIPPLPLYILLEIDVEIDKKSLQKSGSLCQTEIGQDFDDLDYVVESITPKDFKSNNINNNDIHWNFSSSVHELSKFGPSEVQNLSDCLTRVQLPGLSALDQVYLLGIAELMCNLKNDISDNITIDSRIDINESTVKNQKESVGSQQISTNFMDDCGLRFLLAMQHFSYMTRTLPLNQRNALLINGMDTSSVIWGFHSESEEELCIRLDELASHNVTWIDFRRYGCGWWIRNNNILQRVIEKIAKNTFQKSKNPMDCAVFYLALGKQKLLAKLFKNCNQTSLFNFFNMDFMIDENKNRALNQAYNMRSKRRYDHAVALFLLCHSIDDAILICLHNLKDIQLALTISRLYDMNFNRNNKNLNFIIQHYVITSFDPFVRSMGYWILDDYGKSLDSLLIETCDKTTTVEVDDSVDTSSSFNSSDTIVFVFYNFLKRHPIILKQKMILNKNAQSGNSIFTKDTYITPVERRLYFRTAYTYLKMGCPDLALEVLSKLPEFISSSVTSEIHNGSEKKSNVLDDKSESFDIFGDEDLMTDVQFKIQWEENENDEKLTCYDDLKHSESILIHNIDIMCMQYKFMLCLKLISEELCTLATGIESHGSFLRYHLYTWLEKEVEVLQNMCGYSVQLKISESKLEDKKSKGILLFNENCTLSIKERVDLRKIWLKKNQFLILSLYNFCSLHGSNIVGLSAIRMELLILIQELQGNSCIQTDVCRYPHSTVNLPFINSSLTPDNGLIVTPVQQLKTFVVEIVDCLNSFRCPFSFLYNHFAQCQKKSDSEISENKSKIKLLRNQCQALSACLYQCLSNFHGIQSDKNSNLNQENRSRQNSTSVIYSAESDIQLRSKYLPESNFSEHINPNSDPTKWPGYTNLFKITGFKPKKDVANFSHLLAEILVSVYIGILVYSLHLNDVNLLYRLISVEFNKNFWGKVFGGTFRQKPDRPSGPPSNVSSIVSGSSKSMKISSDQNAEQDTSSYPDRYSSLSPPTNQKYTSIDERFIPPTYPILTCLLEKISINPKFDSFIYDSDVEEDDSYIENEEETTSEPECQNSKSYSWCLIRYVILHSAYFEIKSLLKLLQIENEELAIFCPNIFSLLNCLKYWQTQCQINLNSIQIPDVYIEFFKNCDRLSKNDHVTTRLINMCKNLSSIENTPFTNNSTISLAMKRLWVNLIKKSDLQPIFVQHFLNSMRNEKEKNGDLEHDSSISLPTNETSNVQNIRVIHKEHDSLFSIAINQIDKSFLVTSTAKEIVELNINHLLNPEKWFDDDYEYLQNTIKESEKNMKSPNRTAEKCLSNDFLLISPTFGSNINYTSPNYSHSSNVILKRQIHGVQIIKSHPNLPYYLTGNSNGQVGVYEWGVDAAVVKTYSPIQKGKITSLNFDSSGNKFGMGDSEGNFSLFHFSYADNSRAQYYQTHCPHKGVLDFCFLNSSSVVATCGGSSLHGMSSVNHLHAVSGGISNFDNCSINISIWDILLPSGRNPTRNLSDPQLASGVVILCYASRYELLIAGTRKGEIAVIDIRQGTIQKIFQAHDSCITSIKLDPLQYFFVSSAFDGHIKIWRLLDQEIIEIYRSDHVKTSVFSKGDVGIRNLSIIDDNKLISCSADGFIKLRYLEPKILFSKFKSDVVIL